jgi:hypothetical protein
MAKAKETTFFSDELVQITNARAVLANTTYSLANITSVSATYQPTSPTVLYLGIMLVLLAVLLFFVSLWPLGVLLLLIGAACIGIWFMMDVKYCVQIGTAGTEVDALESTDEAYIQKVVDALNEAIVARG